MSEPQIIRNGESYDLDTREHMDNGVSVQMCPNDMGAHSNVSQNLSDTRELLEADLNNLCLDCLRLGWNAANDLKKAIRKLLDRQAAITTAACTSEDESCCEACRAAQKRKIAELTAERDELQSIIDHMPKTEQECEACQEAHDRLMFNAKVHQDELRDKRSHPF